MQADGEPNGYGPWLSALVGMLSSSYHLSIRKIQALLQQLLGIGISTCAIAAIRNRLSAVLTTPVAEALVVVSSQPVVHLDETGAPTGNADSLNPSGRRGWLWMMATAGLSVFQQGPSRSWDASKALLGQGFGGNRFSTRRLRLRGRLRLLGVRIASRPAATSHWSNGNSAGPTCAVI